jgi:hypothetical protein
MVYNCEITKPELGGGVNMSPDQLLLQAKKIAYSIVEETKNIDLVLAYGGLSRRTTNEYSDFDILVISKSSRITWTFVWRGRPVSVWTMSWDEAERLAKGQWGNWCVGASIFSNSLILWSSSKTNEKRFRSLRAVAEEGSHNILEQKLSEFSLLYGYIRKLEDAISCNDVLTPAFLVWDIAKGLIQILSALNNQPLVNNWGRQIEEIKQFKIVPGDFVPRYRKLVTSPPMTALPIARDLVKDVHKLLLTWFHDQSIPKESFALEIKNEWPGALDCLNKIHSAVKDKNPIALRYEAVEYAEYAIWLFQGIRGRKSEVRQFESVPEVITQLPSEHQAALSTLLQSQESHELTAAAEKVKDLLRLEASAVGISLPVVNSLEEAKAFLQISS